MQHIPTVLDHGFEFVGGDLSTDFTNTRSGLYEGPGHEHVQTYADLVEFARSAGALRPSDARRLIAEAERRPERAAHIYRRSIALRDAIWRSFSRLAKEKEPMVEDLEVIGTEAADAFAHARVARSKDGFGWEWPDSDELARPLWPIARAASDLLVSDHDRDLLRECADDICAWLFVDRSKNHTRRWCDMNGCGTRNKMRDYRERQKRVARKAR